MASLTIRNLDDKLKGLLRLEAARHGHSMEEEARQILRSALMGSNDSDGTTLAERINRRFTGLRADEIELPARHNLPLVTRNTKDFAGIEHLSPIKPWQAKP